MRSPIAGRPSAAPPTAAILSAHARTSSTSHSPACPSLSPRSICSATSRIPSSSAWITSNRSRAVRPASSLHHDRLSGRSPAPSPSRSALSSRHSHSPSSRRRCARVWDSSCRIRLPISCPSSIHPERRASPPRASPRHDHLLGLRASEYTAPLLHVQEGKQRQLERSRRHSPTIDSHDPPALRRLPSLHRPSPQQGCGKRGQRLSLTPTSHCDNLVLYMRRHPAPQAP